MSSRLSVHEVLASAREVNDAHDVVLREHIGWYVKSGGESGELIEDNFTFDDFAKFASEYGIDLAPVRSGGHAESFAAQHRDFGRVRVEAAKDVDGISLTVRLLREKPWDFDSIGLPEEAERAMREARRGILLIIGEAGTGKTSVWQSYVANVLVQRGLEVITLEDPVEGRIRHHLVRQYDVSREDGRASFREFTQGLKHGTRCNAGVIVVQEVRDAETADAALVGAESGALVIVTLHCGRSADAPDRLLALLDSNKRELGRMQLANTLVGILAPRLARRQFPEEGEPQRVMVAEWLPGHPDVRLAIKEGDTKALQDFLLNAPSDAEPVLLEDRLAHLCAQRVISQEVARTLANDRDLFDERCNDNQYVRSA